MDKKKVEELIEKTIRFTKVTDDDYIQGNVKSHIINTLQVALKEISKSDWVSVEDELPPYDKVVWVTSKMSPDNVFKTEEWKALPSQKMIMTSSSYGKGEWLVSLIGNLLISWRIDMTREKLIQKAYEFEKKNERLT